MSDRLTRLLKAEEHLERGELDRAEAVCRRLLAGDASDGNAARVLANVLLLKGLHAQALHYCRVAAVHADAHPMFHVVLGRLLRQVATAEETIPRFEVALRMDGSCLDAWIGLTDALLWARRGVEAVRAADAGLANVPGSRELRFNRAIALVSLGRADDAVATLRELHREEPQNAAFAASLAMHLNYIDGVTRDEVFAAHQDLGTIIGRAGVARTPDITEANRSPRIGVLSPDLRLHSVAFFAEPMLRGLADGNFEVTCYSTTPHEDAVSMRLAAMVTRWRSVPFATDAVIADLIRRDGIDVLIDLAGLTGGRKPGVLNAGAAPVVVTYLGYPNTTGIAGVDHRIVDALTDPPGDADAFATERLWRLDPCFLCYSGAADAPAVAPLPAATAGRITFGSFNAASKISNTTLRLWAAVLARVPGSRLLVKGMGLGAESTRDDLRARMTAAGIDAASIEIVAGEATVGGHLAHYGRVDIALDTFPYHGTTTTCEALWMGVPVVSLVGRSHASRVGLSLLSAIGAAEWAVATEDAYAARCAALASNLPALARLRAGLRDRMRASALCDQRAFGTRFAEMLRAMWRGRCGA